MKKIFLLIVAFGCMAAQAQTEEIDAISATQGESTDWYRFADDDVIDVSITAQGIQFPGNPGKTYAIADGAVYTAFGTAPKEKITLSAADLVISDNNFTYDGDAKKVDVSMADDSKILPSSDNITIYYDNNPMLKPINAGTYQVYIDIEETTDYNAVTGLTSDDWKLTIEKADLTASDFTYLAPDNLDWDGNAKTAAVTFNSQDSKLSGCGDITIKYNGSAEAPSAAGDYTVSIDVAEGDNYNAIENLTDEGNWKFTIVDPLSEIKANAIAEIKYVANGAKEEIDGLDVDESAKNEAKAEIGNIANTAEQTINAATSEDAIDNAKTEAIAKIHDVVQTTKDMWITVRTDVTANNWNTICMERNITAIDGATFWNVVSETSTEFILEQEFAPFAAGVGYIIRYTATELKVKYGDQKVDAPVEAKDNDLPIQGRFAEITCDEDGQNELVGNYVVYGNQLCKVTGWVTMADHRAYVIPNIAPSKAPAPTGAPRMTMAKPNSTPTGLGQSAITNHKSAMKVIENGHFRIVRDGKMYTIMGVEE